MYSDQWTGKVPLKRGSINRELNDKKDICIDLEVQHSVLSEWADVKTQRWEHLWCIQFWVNGWCKNSKVKPSLMHSRVGIMDLLHDHVSEKSTCGENLCEQLHSHEELENGGGRAMCPGCSLIIKVADDRCPFMCGETTPAPSTNK